MAEGAREGADRFAGGGALLRAAAPWTILDDTGPGSCGERLARDHALLEAVRGGRSPATARVWENGRCLVATRADARLPDFAAACARLAEEGWPVLVRESGGSAVPHAEGVLQLALAFRPPEAAPCSLDAAYAALALPLRDALHSLGVEASLGEAPGSFCDGRFNLVVEGRKVAGTAQRWRARPGVAEPGRGAILAHASLFVEGDLRELCDVVNRFYAVAGGARRCRPDASVTLRERVGATRADARAALLAALRALLPTGAP